VRIVEVDRRKLLRAEVCVSGAESVTAEWVTSVLDRHRIPDGFPLVIDDDGTLLGCHRLNQYLLDALDQNGFDLGSMRRFHVYNLARLLRFVRRHRAGQAARDAGVDVEDWLREHGEARLDLTDATRADLNAYKASRKLVVQEGSWKTEAGCLSGFYTYATQMEWIDRDPVSRWGKRNTFAGRATTNRIVKFLTEDQLRLFLNCGLRGDAPADPATLPAYPERDYSFGLFLVATGLRREEGALLLDAEIPQPEGMPSDGVWPFTRYGKGGSPRMVYATLELARAIDLYRSTERVAIIDAAQPRLRRLRRAGELFMVDRLTTDHGGRLHLVAGGHRMLAERLDDERRARAAHVRADGAIEPLALFLGRGGLPLSIKYWNAIFTDAHTRVSALHHDARPPAHLTVSPHVLRHSFAVRMLSALMREGRDRSGDPYHLLANPVLTVMQLLGHASVETTQLYLFAAERYSVELPAALRSLLAGSVGHTEGDPGEAIEAIEADPDDEQDLL
jgi:integrase